MEMTTVPGYKNSGWEKGYGDYVMKPDMATLRALPWMPGTALVLCDLLDHHHNDVPQSPRAILKRQIARAEAMGFKAMMATELEFFLFETSFDAVRNSMQASGQIRDLKPISAYNEDYHIFQTSKEEEVMRALRNGLYGAGIPVECSKGEADAGQGGDQRQIFGRARHGRQSRDHQDRRQGHRPCRGQVGDLHGEIRPPPRGLVEPCAPVALDPRRQARLLRPRGPARHVGADAPVSRGPAGPCRGDHRLPRALCEQLQAVLRRHVRPHESRLEPRQPHRGLPRLRRGHQGHPRRMPDRGR